MSAWVDRHPITAFPAVQLTIATVWQRCYKHIGRDDFSGIRISDGGSIAGPVHLHDFARLVVQVHGCVDLCQIVSIVLVELS